jgi:peptidoglycan/LPS O-acetylase OafA/YrhL
MTTGTNASHEGEGHPARRRGRSVWALFAGFLVVVLLSIGTDVALHAIGVFPPLGQPMSDPLFRLATAYRSVYATLGSAVTARLAPRRPMQHALLGGAIGLVLATAGALASWSRAPEFGPHWYPVSLIVTALPCAWLGGRLGSRRSRARETR